MRPRGRPFINNKGIILQEDKRYKYASNNRS